MEFDRERYFVWSWKNPLVLHYILNPALAFNELVLGQRLPAVTLIDRTLPRPLVERQYIPCPACGAHNHAMAYAKVAFGNYAGLVCAECGERIPTLKNALSWLILMITWPLWKPLERRYGPGMRARQFAKLQEVKGDIAPLIKRASGVRMGLYFGAIMAVFFIVGGLIDGRSLTEAAIGGGVGGLMAGVFFGVVMKMFLSVRGRERPDQPEAR